MPRARDLLAINSVSDVLGARTQHAGNKKLGLSEAVDSDAYMLVCLTYYKYRIFRDK